MNPEPAEIDALTAEILASKKYRGTGMSADTVRDVLVRELSTHKNKKDALHAARQKLHNIAAPYLGDPDYALASERLEVAFASHEPEAVRQVCTWILSQHASTEERLSTLEAFYTAIFEVIGKPGSILDLACGLNPFAIPWMDLPAGTKYHAYDIHAPRLELIQNFFGWLGIDGETHLQDVIVCPVTKRADAAFFFKEAHRFEQRQRGVNAPFWEALPVRWLVVSLPASGLSGRYDLSTGHRSLVYGITARHGWAVTELQVGSELIFCIDKGSQAPDGQKEST
jgi:16S rRNA (guanine(1405)-N(7))-methyltransferase